MSPLTSLFFVGLAVLSADRAERKSQLFAAWDKAQRNVKTLVVEFKIQFRDVVFNKTTKSTGVLRLGRDEIKGQKVMLIQATITSGKAEDEDFAHLLFFDDECYSINEHNKTYVKSKMTKSELLGLIEPYVLPPIVLLDRDRAEREYDVRVFNRDKWYTYTQLTRKQAWSQRWFSIESTKSWVVFMNGEVAPIPKDMPRQIRFSYNNQDIDRVVDITSWRVNAGDLFKPAEFTRPDGRDGWRSQGLELSDLDRHDIGALIALSGGRPAVKGK